MRLGRPTRGEMDDEELSAQRAEMDDEELSARLEAIYDKKLKETIAELVAAGKPSPSNLDAHIAMYQKLDPSKVVALFKNAEGEWVYSTAGTMLENLLAKAAAAQ
jgi:hypothetical protein